MRKLTFYPKLALSNLWRNRRTYLPYMLASVISIFTLFTMLTINMNGALQNLPKATIVISFAAIAAVILAIFCTVLIFYTNSFLIKRRKQELGLYSILGMQKKNIAMVLLFETLFIALIALALGLLCGLLFSKLIFLLLLRMVRFPVDIAMPVSPSAIGITVGFFCIVFLLTLLSNLRQVRIANPISLLSGAKQGEKEPKASIILTIVGILTLAGGYGMAIYFKNPVEALLMFLVAALLVIIGTYCLFTSGSIAILKLLRRNKNFYYKSKNYVTISGLIYRMKQNAAGLASICVLSCMVLVTVSSTVSLNVGSSDSIKEHYPNEVQVTSSDFGYIDAIKAEAEVVADDLGIEVKNLRDMRLVSFYTKENEGGYRYANDLTGESNPVQFNLTILEDFNASEMKNYTLSDGEALIFCLGGHYSGNTIMLNGIEYRLTPIESLNGKRFGTNDFMRTYTLILPDQSALDRAVDAAVANGAATGTEETTVHRMLAFDTTGTQEERLVFAEMYAEVMRELGVNSSRSYTLREPQREEWYATIGGFLFLGIYFGILFLLAAVMIIYYKQMSEGYDDKDRFEIMQKVGMGEAEVRSTIDRQVLTVFFLPLLAAIVHIAVALIPVSRVLVIFGITNTTLLVLCTAACVVVYALIYLMVYRKTAKTYFKIVQRKIA